MFSFVWIISVLFALVVFLLPTIIAVFRHKKNITAILVLNLLGGWTVVGWIIALVWAFAPDRIERK